MSSDKNPATGGLGYIIQPTMPEFQDFLRQFKHYLHWLIKASPKFKFVPLVFVIPGWVTTEELDNYWFETVSILPQELWLNAGQNVENLLRICDPNDYLLRTRLFYKDTRVEVATMPMFSEDNPKQPYVEIEPTNEAPYYRCTAIKGLENAPPARWTEITAKLSRGEVLFSQRNLKPGRPPGTGWFKSVTDFKTALDEILAECAKVPTQLELLIKLDAHPLCNLPPTKNRTQSDTKHLRNWLGSAGFEKFQSVLKQYFPNSETGTGK